MTLETARFVSKAQAERRRFDVRRIAAGIPSRIELLPPSPFRPVSKGRRRALTFVKGSCSQARLGINSSWQGKGTYLGWTVDSFLAPHLHSP